MQEKDAAGRNDSEEISRLKVEIETLNQLLNVQEQVTIEQSGLLSQKLRELQAAVEDLNQEVSKRRKAEEEIKRLYEFNKLILDSMVDSIAIIRVEDFSIIECNDAFLKGLCLKKEEVLGRYCYELTHGRTEPCRSPDDVCPLRDAVETGKSSIVEHRHHAKDGGSIYVEVSAYPIKDEEGKVAQIVHVAKNITERTKAQEALVIHSRELEQMNKAAVGRELKMIELKKEIEELKKKT